jgi:hypothetical protein
LNVQFKFKNVDFTWQVKNFAEIGLSSMFVFTFSFSQGQRATLNEQRTARTAGTAFVK